MKKKRKRKDTEIQFYESLIKKRPNFVHALISLGDAYTRRGFYEEGLAIDKKLVRLRPDDPVVHYNLACSLSLLGKLDEALQELKNAVLLGYNDFDYILKDPDLKNLHTHPEFKNFWQKIMRLKKD